MDFLVIVVDLNWSLPLCLGSLHLCATFGIKEVLGCCSLQHSLQWMESQCGINFICANRKTQHSFETNICDNAKCYIKPQRGWVSSQCVCSASWSSWSYSCKLCTHKRKVNLFSLARSLSLCAVKEALTLQYTVAAQLVICKHSKGKVQDLHLITWFKI